MAISIRHGRAFDKFVYSATVRVQKDKVVVRCPELGVSSEGRDRSEALHNLREAIRSYLEAFGAPKSLRDPRDIVVTVVPG